MSTVEKLVSFVGDENPESGTCWTPRVIRGNPYAPTGTGFSDLQFVDLSVPSNRIEESGTVNWHNWYEFRLAWFQAEESVHLTEPSPFYLLSPEESGTVNWHNWYENVCSSGGEGVYTFSSYFSSHPQADFSRIFDEICARVSGPGDSEPIPAEQMESESSESSVLGFFDVDDPKAVTGLLSEYPGMSEILLEAHEAIEKAFAQHCVSVGLSVHTDPEYHKSSLLLKVRSDLSPRDSLRLLDQLDEDWLLGVEDPLINEVIITV